LPCGAASRGEMPSNWPSWCQNLLAPAASPTFSIGRPGCSRLFIQLSAPLKLILRLVHIPIHLSSVHCLAKYLQWHASRHRTASRHLSASLSTPSLRFLGDTGTSVALRITRPMFAAFWLSP